MRSRHTDTRPPSTSLRLFDLALGEVPDGVGGDRDFVLLVEVVDHLVLQFFFGVGFPLPTAGVVGVFSGELVGHESLLGSVDGGVATSAPMVARIIGLFGGLPVGHRPVAGDAPHLVAVGVVDPAPTHSQPAAGSGLQVAAIVAFEIAPVPVVRLRRRHPLRLWLGARLDWADPREVAGTSSGRGCLLHEEVAVEL